ncbi:RhoGAP-domain-containing protein [Atractiella rhizophila]|nr:RhoGAP-domain-containing protein [Atractiella rhizophila]
MAPSRSSPGTQPDSLPSPTSAGERFNKPHWWKLPWKNSDERGKEKSRGVNDKNGGVFGVHLSESLKYASVAISMVNAEDGKSYIYGYIPIVVAKCGLFLKENATETEGVFRVSGSAKRMKELQAIFDAPPKYGKDLQWLNYSVHDAASVLRRFLNMMPEPVVPYDLYHSFRDCLTHPGQSQDAKIQHFRLLLLSVPPSSQCLLLYVLDLLSVFARNSSVNLMTASNLAVVFQPGLVRPPETDLTNLGESTAQEIKALAGAEAKGHKSSQEILEFLIEHQDHFLLGLGPPPTVVSSSASANASAAASQASIPQTQVPQPASPTTAGRPSLSSERKVVIPPEVPSKGAVNLGRKGSGRLGNKLRKSLDNYRQERHERRAVGSRDGSGSGAEEAKGHSLPPVSSKDEPEDTKEREL